MNMIWDFNHQVGPWPSNGKKKKGAWTRWAPQVNNRKDLENLGGLYNLTIFDHLVFAVETATKTGPKLRHSSMHGATFLSAHKSYRWTIDIKVGSNFVQADCHAPLNLRYDQSNYLDSDINHVRIMWTERHEPTSEQMWIFLHLKILICEEFKMAMNSI